MTNTQSKPIKEKSNSKRGKSTKMTNTQSKPIKEKSYSERSPVAKNRLTKKALKDLKKKRPGWHILAELLNCGLLAIQITFADKRNDCYGMHVLKEAILAGLLDDLNPVGVHRLRHSLSNGDGYLNPKNGFPRYVIIVALDEDDLNEEGVEAPCLLIKEYLERKENNKFETPVIMEEGAWNLTPEDPVPLRNLDCYVVYEDILKVISKIFGEDQVTPAFVENNRESAFQIFTEGHVPYRASADLGFAQSECLPVRPIEVDVDGEGTSS